MYMGQKADGTLKQGSTEDWQTDRVNVAVNGLIDCVPFIMSIIIVKFVPKLYPLAKNFSSYTVNPTDVGFCSFCSRLADLRAEAEEFVALKRQLRMLPNFERNHTGLHLDHSLFIINFLDFVDEGQPTIFVTVRLGKTWNHIMLATKVHDGEATSDKSNQRTRIQGDGVKASQRHEGVHYTTCQLSISLEGVLRTLHHLEDCEKLKFKRIIVHSVGRLVTAAGPLIIAYTNEWLLLLY